MDNKVTQKNLANHILPTAANLLGICFLIFSFVHVQSMAEKTFIDELTAFAIIVFLLASLFSYISLRSDKGWHYERIADLCFFLGLTVLAVTAIGLTLKYII